MKVKELIEKSGYNQEQISEHIGVSKPTWNKKLQYNYGSLTVTQVIKLSELLKINVKKLVKLIVEEIK